MDSCKVVLTFEPVAKLPAVTNQLTPTCQYFLGALKKNVKGTGVPRTKGIPWSRRFVTSLSRFVLTFVHDQSAKTKCLGRRRAGNLICHKIFSEK